MFRYNTKNIHFISSIITPLFVIMHIFLSYVKFYAIYHIADHYILNKIEVCISYPKIQGFTRYIQ